MRYFCLLLCHFLLWHFLTLELVVKESFQDTSHLIERMTIDGMFTNVLLMHGKSFLR
jgi:hypothetical protein